VTRYVLPLRKGELAALCDGKAQEISTAKKP
jgi:hypothetical protein